ncbi:MAG: ribosomal-protein-alanine N-acetyltransferase [Candidatus Marinimicrobia bacterium]|nr:ribosomal-protein-alanine N-acetyltransferase [Candidatus Neomarinimicrobiota bacterium]
MIIRQGIKTDLEKIYQIEKLVFPKSYWSKSMLSQELQFSNDRLSWVVEKCQELIGYCMLRFGFDEIQLINMAILPQYQKRGVGTSLLNHFLNQIPPKTSVSLEVERGNFPAINLYLKTGFEEIGIRKNYYQNGSDAMVMQLTTK